MKNFVSRANVINDFKPSRDGSTAIEVPIVKTMGDNAKYNDSTPCDHLYSCWIVRGMRIIKKNNPNPIN